MYKEVAFDPTCMAYMEYYGLVTQHFGFDNGRYIAADFKAWAREAMIHVKDSGLQPIKQQSIKNYLNKLARSKYHEEFILTEDRKGVKVEEWRQWWKEQRKTREFSITISESAGDGCINIDQINDGCIEWNVSPSISVKRYKVQDIVNALLPLAVISKDITIIDQYFRLADNPVLVQLFKHLTNFPVRKLRIMTSMDTVDASRVYEQNYCHLNTQPIDFEWIKAPDKFFHDRYFISNIGAIRSGQGFMTEVKKGTHADLANLNIISRDEADRTIRDLEELLASGRAIQELKV